MTTDKLTREQKRKKLLEEKNKRNLRVIEDRTVKPYKRPCKVDIKKVDDFYDYDN